MQVLDGTRFLGEGKPKGKRLKPGEAAKPGLHRGRERDGENHQSPSHQTVLPYHKGAISLFDTNRLPQANMSSRTAPI